MAKLTEEEKNQARQSLSSSIGSAARSAVDTIGQASSFTRDRNKPVDIYAEGSPTERVQRNMASPLAATVGTATDAATLIPRAFGKVADNMYRGFTGQPEGDEFVMNPATRSLMGRNEQPASPTRSFSAVDNSKFTEPQTALTTRAEGSFKPPQYNLVGKPTRAPFTGDAGTDIAETRSFMNADDEWRKSQGTPTSTEFNKTLMRDFDKFKQENAAPVREAINGDVTRRFSPSGQTTTMPFPSPPSRAQYLNEKDTNARFALDNEAYQNKVNAYRALNGQIPLDQAQAGEATARTGEIPLTGKSTREYQAAQTRETNAKADEGNYTKVKRQVPYGEPDHDTGKQQFVDEEVLYDKVNKRYVEAPGKQQTAPQNNILAELNSGQKPQAIYQKYFASAPHDQASVLLDSMPAGEARNQLAKLMRDRWNKENQR